MNRVLNIDNLKMQLRMMFALLALLAAGIANAGTTVEYKGHWQIVPPVKLPDFAVQVSNDSYRPTYRVQFPNGDVVELPATPVIPNNRLTVVDAKAAAEDTRFILEGAIRVLASGTGYVNAIVVGDYIHAQKLDSDWLRSKGSVEFDPMTAVYSKRKVLSEVNSDSELPPEIVRSRFLQMVIGLRDAIFTSTVDAWHVFRIHNTHSQKFEYGFQILLRAEIQMGIGKHNIMRSFPIDFSIGYDRLNRRLVFRRGIRQEKMLGGSATSLAVKAELKVYRANPEIIDKGDARPGYGAFQAESWYPPSIIPFLSLVADSGRGFQSVGLVFSLNFADIIPGSYLMNTVNGYTETQIAVYSAPIPDRAMFFSRLQAQVNESANAFGVGFTRGGRCELIFKSVP